MHHTLKNNIFNYFGLIEREAVYVYAIFSPSIYIFMITKYNKELHKNKK